MRAAAVQLESTVDTERNLATAERLVRGAAADGAELVVLPERLDIRGAAVTTWPARSRSTGVRSAGRAGSRASSRSTWSRAPSRSAARATSASRTPPLHVGPDGELKAVYRKIHMFDVVVGGVEYRESESSEPADEIVVSETAGGVGLGLSVCLRPALPRAVPDPRAAGRPHRDGSGELHARHGRGALGDPAASAGDREPGLRDRARAGQPARPRGRQLRQLDDRRPLGRGVGARARARAPGDRRPTSTSRARTRSGRSSRASRTASRRPTAAASRRKRGRRAAAAPKGSAPSGHRLEVERRRRQAQADPRRGRARVRAARLPPLPRVGRRGRGGRRLRARLPLLRLQGGDPQHALPRALADHARRDRGDRRERPRRAREAAPRSPASSSSPTGTTRT